MKDVSVDRLFAFNDADHLSAAEVVLPLDWQPNIREVEDLYRLHYAHGLDKVFETQWYTTYGWNHFRQDASLVDFAGRCAERFKVHIDEMTVRAVQSLESQLVWRLVTMPRSSWGDTHCASNAPDAPALSELFPRIDVVEHLLTGQFLTVARAPPPPPTFDQKDQVKDDQLSFWHRLGYAVSVRDDTPDPSALAQMHDALVATRGLLNGVESRDVLYSMLVGRHIGGRYSYFHPDHSLPRTDNPAHELDKLEVARQYLFDLDQRGWGSTQVIQRLCSMTRRGWIVQGWL